ncbi:hypothetical protein GE300_02865 [Rhodobacteraceae bacterium 2CG4]|uniref:Uncharacterized protein n=1 Tax=Halovulum marinum TaxID=2662447 RepID=A0A6L5YX80_9RHOB|nr:hypothetical protein [Halovulum marinum]MSU88560.1 hypothetical protein [Halovulum marinum]
MARAGRRLRSCLAAPAIVLAWAAAGAPALAVDPDTVERFVRLSDRFHAQLEGSSPVAGLSAPQRRSRAVCILTRFEEGFGAAGVLQLLDLMSVLSKGAQFDDPTIIAFNERFGADYRMIQGECTRQARGS